MQPMSAFLATVSFLCWWAAWTVADFYFEPYTPVPQGIVLLVCALALGLYVEYTRQSERAVAAAERADMKLTDGRERV